jgi:hypothetical protein
LLEFFICRPDYNNDLDFLVEEPIWIIFKAAFIQHSQRGKFVFNWFEDT